jgi:hypothetical protein
MPLDLLKTANSRCKHGVMNTDNISIAGLTLDYGPYAFMDVYDSGHVCNHTDEDGRYAFKVLLPRICVTVDFDVGCPHSDATYHDVRIPPCPRSNILLMSYPALMLFARCSKVWHRSSELKKSLVMPLKRVGQLLLMVP